MHISLGIFTKSCQIAYKNLLQARRQTEIAMESAKLNETFSKRLEQFMHYGVYKEHNWQLKMHTEPIPTSDFRPTFKTRRLSYKFFRELLNIYHVGLHWVRQKN